MKLHVQNVYCWLFYVVIGTFLKWLVFRVLIPTLLWWHAGTDYTNIKFNLLPSHVFYKCKFNFGPLHLKLKDFNWRETDLDCMNSMNFHFLKQQLIKSMYILNTLHFPTISLLCLPLKHSPYIITIWTSSPQTAANNTSQFLCWVAFKFKIDDLKLVQIFAELFH